MKREKTRVLYVLGPGELAGIQRHVHALLRHLPERVEPQVMFLFDRGPGSDAIASDGFPVHVFGCRSGHDPRLISRIVETLRRFRPHVVHTHESHFVPLAVLMLFRRPGLIHTEHCSLTQFTRLWKTRVLYRMLRTRGALVLAVSRATAESVLNETSMDRDRVRVVPNSIDLSSISKFKKPGLRGSLGLEKNVLLVGGVGRLVAGKGWEDFLEVCRLVSKRDLRPHFVLAGTGPLESKLRSVADQIGFGGRFHFLGERTDGPGVISELDVFVLTSFHEEMPTTLLEAFAVGTPVAGFLPEGGTEDILATAEPLQVAAIQRQRNIPVAAAEVIRLLDDSDLQAMLTRNAREIVDRMFSMENTAREMANIYSEIEPKTIV